MTKHILIWYTYNTNTNCMPLDTIASLLKEKNILQLSWMFIFVFMMTLVNIVYNWTQWLYKVFKIFVMSVWASMLVWVTWYYLEWHFLIILFCTWVTAFISEKFWDTITELTRDLPKAFTKVFKEVLLNYLSKWKK